jgi:hypothetical protein
MPNVVKRYIRLAKSVLSHNHTSGYTMPSSSLYPHQWNWDSGFIVTISALLLWSFLFLFSTTIVSYAQDKKIFLYEDFDNLKSWEPLTFPEIQEHTLYSAENENGFTFLRAESKASASAIISTEEFNVYEYTSIRWRWKIGHVYKRGDARHKSGDDYPIRIYIVFKYDPDTAPLGTKMKYGLAKKLYGEYPPHSSLNYIWANKYHDKKILTNSYTDVAKMIILQSGSDKAGTWQEEEINIIHDYILAFKRKPPPIAKIAIMNDSDNTSESSVSYIDFIEIFE